MKTIIMFVLMVAITSPQLNAQNRKSTKSKNKQKVAFKFTRGVHKVKLPGSKSVLTITIIGKKPKIFSK